MSLKPEKTRRRDQLLGIFRSRSPFGHASTSTQSPVLQSDHDSLSAVSQSPSQRKQLYSDTGSDRPPSPFKEIVNHQNTGDIAHMGEIAMEVVKESFKVVVRLSDVFPPLKSVAGALVEIFDRIDAVKSVQVEAAQLHEQVKKLATMLEAYQRELPPSAKDRLDGLHRALEEKRVALEKKLDRSLATRVVFSTQDTQFLVQVLREITFSIEVTTFDMTVRSYLGISKIYDNTVLDKLGYIVGAEFNHEDRQGCTLGTRVSLLADLLSWATACDSYHVFWLNGMAGTGKTTVMETFCSLLDEKGLLGASFFCSIKSRRNVRSIFPAVAKTLAGNYSRFREKLVEVLATCSDPLGMDLKHQYQTLIIGPAEAVFGKDEIIVISIDALDECDDQEGTEKLLSIILDRKPNIPLRFFATSRPERHIREAFEQRHHFSLRLHDIEDHVVQADISLYLNDRLGGVRKLKQRYGSSWPPPEISIIVERAGKLFIYASTVYKYIIDRGDPVERLQEVTALEALGPPGTVAVERMEKLYDFILSEAFTGLNQKEASRLWSCLSILVSTQRPLTVSTYAKLLGTKADLIRTALESLHSVIIVPDADDQTISIYHASFPDYLATRADNMRPAHKESAIRCFRFMNSELRLGISGVITSHRRNDDQPQTLFVPAYLKYTCTAWGYLVLQLIGPDDLIIENIQTEIEAFLRSKFLYWLEVLSAIGDVPHASHILYRLSQKVPESQPLKLILIDFAKFTNTFLHPIRSSAPHIYLSALPFSSPTSMVFKLFLSKFPSLPIVHQSIDSTYTQHPILLLEGHKERVSRVVFSPNGKHIASGSDDSTIRLWNIDTGEAAFKPFHGHKDKVRSIAFSPNGNYIASSSNDGTTRLWNIETGKATLIYFEGNVIKRPTSISFTSDGKYIISVIDCTIQHWNIETDEVVSTLLPFAEEDILPCSAAISPDGNRVAYGSYNGRLQVWNIEMGKPALKLFEEHAYSITCAISFSPDGKYIVSGSWDYLIRLWNAETGEAPLKVIRGHTSWVRSVMFSPDGEYIVSGSDDDAVRVWNVKTGEAALEPFAGHTAQVASVSFSPDGKYIVSGSADRTIQLWKFETDNGASRSVERHGHTSFIYSVSFSPDGKHIVSGSDDTTIRLWNVETGELALKPFEGHTSAVSAVTFSPDGGYIASGSRDYTTRLWNAKTGELEVTLAPFGGPGEVGSVSFSPDGKYLASNSFDDTIKLQNVKTGETVLELSGKYRGSITFSPNGEHIASCSSDGIIQLWSIETGEVFKSFGVHGDWLRSIAFSPDGKYTLAGSQNGKVRVWNIETGEAAWESSHGELKAIVYVAFSPDGKYAISGSDPNIQRWAFETDELVSKPLEGHQSYIYSISISPDGKYIASGSADHTIRIYKNDLEDQMKDLTTAQAAFLHQYPTGSVVTGPAREGWLHYPSGDLMLWVPPELHLGLYLPSVVNILGADGIKIELSRFVHGTEWSRCQDPEKSF